MRLFQRPGTNHVLHLLITLILFAISSFAFGILGFIWLIIWILCAASKGSYRCTQCGEAAKESHVVIWALLALLVFGGFSMFLKSNEITKKRAVEREEKRSTVVIRTNPADKKAKLRKDIVSQKTKEYQEFLEGSSNKIKEVAQAILCIKEFEYESKNGKNTYAGSEQEAIDKSKIVKDVENGITLGTETEIQNLKKELTNLIEQKISEYNELRDMCADEVKNEMDLTLRIKKIEYERVNGFETYTNSLSSAVDMSDLVKSAKNNELPGSEEKIETLKNRLKELNGE